MNKKAKIVEVISDPIRVCGGCRIFISCYRCSINMHPIEEAKKEIACNDFVFPKVKQ